VSTICGDLRDPETLDQLLMGVGAVYHICPNVHPAELAIGRAVVEAATRQSTPRVVYHSVMLPQIASMPHHWRKHQVEQLLADSPVGSTVLQPCAYMNNLPIARIAETGVLEVPYSRSARISMVDLDDVAEAAAVVLTDPGHDGATYQLAGPQALDAYAVAEVLGEALARPIIAQRSDLAAWRTEALRRGLDEEQIGVLTSMFAHYDAHGFTGSPLVLQWLLGRQPTALRAHALTRQRVRIPAR
jgi:uncharacterized protein YbjT (DUF2867 family)